MGRRRYLVAIGSAMALLGAARSMTEWPLALAQTSPAAERAALQAPPGPTDASQPGTPGSEQAALAAFGLEIARDTPKWARSFVGGTLSCTDCHIDAGRQGDAWPWLGIASRFPEHDPRTGQTITLAQRIQECFLRSENGTAPPTDDPTVQALVEYIRSLDVVTTNHPPGPNYSDVIPPANRIPIGELPQAAGEALYSQNCVMCHGPQGEGVGNFPPLWGPNSFNQGAGSGHVYTLAGFIRANMPANRPGSLTDAEAQQLAAFIDSQPRPPYAGMAQDYGAGDIPPDAVYYLRQTPGSR